MNGKSSPRRRFGASLRAAAMAAPLVFTPVALGQGVLDRLQNLGQPGQQEGQQDGRQDAQPQTPGEKLNTPEWVKPGLRVVYFATSSIEGPANARPGEPGAAGSAGMGPTVVDVLAVTDRFVMTSAASLARIGMGEQLMYAGGGTQFITAMSTLGGDAFFTPPEVLKELQSGSGIEVQRGPMEFNNQTVQAVTVTVRTQDAVSRRTYDAESGLLLMSQSASGPLRRGEQHNEFNRQSRESSQFMGLRMVEGPWTEAAWPAWADTVREMRYEGQMIYSAAGFTQAYPARSTLRISERGEGWAKGSTEMRVDIQGMPENTSRAETGMARGMLAGYWMSPQALRQMNQGVIDRDPHTGTITRYQRSGAHGVLTLETTGRSRITNYFNLETGALDSLRIEQPELNQTIELRLTNRR
ncbi:MAG: hypothetical protein JJU33_06160 [Phycisphaerales bacterium]|nr:hypothetical protein [Phycisphaerales bacterium]